MERTILNNESASLEYDMLPSMYMQVLNLEIIIGKNSMQICTHSLHLPRLPHYYLRDLSDLEARMGIKGDNNESKSKEEVLFIRKSTMKTV